MSAFIAANLAPIMFGALMLFLLSGFPLAFALSACGLVFGLIGMSFGLLPDTLFQAIPLRILGIMQNETMLAIPFFTLMGLVLERSGMAEELLDTIGQLFGPMRGGLALAVVFVGALLAATTGIIAASVISMGLISLPIMLRYGYSRTVAAGVITASGTLAQALPPSLVLIVMADQLGVSVGDMYKGAFVPAFMLIGMYVLYILGLAIFRPHTVPALPPEAITLREPDGRSGARSTLVLVALVSTACIVFAQYYPELKLKYGNTVMPPGGDEVVVVSMLFGLMLSVVIALLNRLFGLGLLSRMAERVTFVMIPPLALIFLVLGTIFLAIATPTEGGAMGAVGALLMAFSRRKMKLRDLIQVLDSTTRLSVFVIFILIGSTVFSFTFNAIDGHLWIEHLFDKLPGGQLGFLVFVMLVVFILGCFLDYFEIAFIIIPLLVPVALSMDIDLVWFGILIAITLQTSFLTPPFGFALFFLRSVAPATAYTDRVTGRHIDGVGTFQIYRGVVPFVLIQLSLVGVLIAYPGIVASALGPKVEVDLDTIRIEAPGWGGGWGDDAPAAPTSMPTPAGDGWSSNPWESSTSVPAAPAPSWGMDVWPEMQQRAAAPVAAAPAPSTRAVPWGLTIWPEMHATPATNLAPAQPSPAPEPAARTSDGWAPNIWSR